LRHHAVQVLVGRARNVQVLASRSAKWFAEQIK
jgi:hypothetical protein